MEWLGLGLLFFPVSVLGFNVFFLKKWAGSFKTRRRTRRPPGLPYNGLVSGGQDLGKK